MAMVEGSVHDSAYKGDLEHVRINLDRDSTWISKQDNNERLLLHWAAVGGHVPIVTLLLEKGSPVDPTDDFGATPLILAASAGKEDVVNLLIKHHANVNAKNQQGHSALQLAASKGWRSIIQLLLAAKADVNIKDSRGATALHRAASQGRTPIVNILIAVPGIDLSPADIDGNTPLHLACEEDRRDDALELVQRGASLSIKNKEEKTPMDLASPGLGKQLRECSEQ
ncbi:26S proteasome non-ATPase regulatory subunit 10-like [Neocloeon triangulifer]|uniref:26S proteasome non-ATPase regulatory subunit 10-like n=1 Tax=Neocloeon triangulifer TaxID=2078957 RepID=UPI00286FA27C|nr:26S proteasome non-ATPase regulatory subunit 10-like [Neocloeon triangulifer]